MHKKNSRKVLFLINKAVDICNLEFFLNYSKHLYHKKSK